MFTSRNFWILILTVGVLESSVTSGTTTNDEIKLFEARSPRRGGLFHICGSNAYAEEGSSSCMPRSKCVNQGGKVKGFCNIYEVCCETKVDCNSIIKEKRVVIKSAALEKTPSSCSYRIQRFSNQVCQVLIEFKSLELQPPIFDATQSSLECEDHVVIGDFILCGENSGQHLYVPYDGSKDDTELIIKFALPNKWSQSQWHLIVTQLQCPRKNENKKRSPSYMPFINSNNLENLRTIFTIPYNSNSKNALDDIDLLAPLGCNQYFTQSEGQIKSFNYKSDGSGYYLSKMNYVICIKPVKSANMIQYVYSLSIGHTMNYRFNEFPFLRYQVEKFSLSKQNTEEPGFDNNCHSYNQVNGDDRREDYLLIPQSSLTANGTIIMATHYCGQSLVKGSSVIGKFKWRL
uniref:CUB domain-containing protein n=1 Tax=Glossina palpalis gambiensis TaxID=67801 RepID=A0A1B0BFM7_9MUSC